MISLWSRHLPPTRVATSYQKHTRSIQVPNPRYLQIITPQIHIYSTGMYRVETIGWYHPAEGRSGFPLVPHHPGSRGRSPEGKDTNPMENGRLLLATSNLPNAVRSLLQSYPPVSSNVASWQIPKLNGGSNGKINEHMGKSSN